MLISGQEVQKSSRSEKLVNLFAIIQQTSKQSLSYITNLAASIPFAKLILTGGALLSFFFVFIRFLIVLGPIILMGTLTRESSEATDFLKSLIEFYNQIVLTLEDQTRLSSEDAYTPEPIQN